jgi:hypothetical protein
MLELLINVIPMLLYMLLCYIICEFDSYLAA